MAYSKANAPMTSKEIREFIKEEFGPPGDRFPIYDEAEFNVLVKDKIRNYMHNKGMEANRDFVDYTFEAVCYCIYG